MGSGTSFLDTATVAELSAIRRDGFATRVAVAGFVSLVLARWSGASETYVAQPAQEVLVTYASRVERTERAPAALATSVDGWLEKLEPFNVETDDVFSFGGMAGRITIVLPPQFGVQRAGWALRTGEVS